MANEKIVGYSLLTIGLYIIGFALFNVFGIFNLTIKPAQVFDLPGFSIDLGQSYDVNLPQELVDAGVKVDVPESQKQEIFPADSVNQTSNFIAHLVIMGFVVSAGFKVASLGTQLIRPIVVKSNNIENIPNEKSLPER